MAKAHGRVASHVTQVSFDDGQSTWACLVAM
ncbi:hypothetical protein F383_25382 [Gossypium arboreum]|uniref:Uncharacterized protein n=1 Tax=Gossypium arboreum TaxID=29729 RepID=A0A0B0P2L3_GOSAR|nr:hypothetical protein F383_25382 [Gossypium arboreum]